MPPPLLPLVLFGHVIIEPSFEESNLPLLGRTALFIFELKGLVAIGWHQILRLLHQARLCVYHLFLVVNLKALNHKYSLLPDLVSIGFKHIVLFILFS